MTIQRGYRYKIRKISIIHFHLFCLVFVSFLLTPSNPRKEYYVTRSFDYEFLPFMKKMYSDMPSLAKVNQEMKGPSLGYRPYWYAYNYALHGMPKQKDPNKQASSHEDWDYGLGKGSVAAARGLWGGGNLSLVAAGGDDVLGAAELMDQDLVSSSEKHKCYPNMGKTCKLGRSVWEYSAAEIARILTRSRNCDYCSYQFRWVGLVCTIDKSGVMQEMDACVMEKMNCLGGVAYVAGRQWRYNLKFAKVPFALKPHWARIAIRGPKDAEIRLFNTCPYWYALYWIVLSGYPYQGPISAIFPDSEEPYHTPAVWYKKNRYWGYVINNNNYTEYTMVWNSQNGWFLLSQPRARNWQSEFYIEYVDPMPREFKYFDVASGWSGEWVEFMLSDLPSDLARLNRGHCVYTVPNKEELASSTGEMHKEVRNAEQAYQERFERLQARDLEPEAWSPELGSYIEYQ